MTYGVGLPLLLVQDRVSGAAENRANNIAHPPN